MTCLPEPTRRGFLAGLASGLLALRALPAAAADKVKKVAVALAKIDKLTQIGGWAIVKIKDRNVLLIRDTDKTVRALDPTCSHQKCTVAYDPPNGVIRCPCHKSAYALDGMVREGPAPKPLTVYPANLDGDRIIITLPET